MSLHVATCECCGTQWFRFGDRTDQWDQSYQVVWCSKCPPDCDYAQKPWHDPERSFVKGWTKAKAVQRL